MADYEKDCPFCNIGKLVNKERILYEDATWIAVLDRYPVSEGHTLLIPKRHCTTYFDLNFVESDSLAATIKVVKALLDAKYKPNGYNIGVNCGEAAGQTVHHCHIHIIPRYNGDCENPRGGVRGVIPSKQHY
jgi:diadenosine tetraphosphate (Ap4A) HIT family hydrolase